MKKKTIAIVIIAVLTCASGCSATTVLDNKNQAIDSDDTTIIEYKDLLNNSNVSEGTEFKLERLIEQMDGVESAQVEITNDNSPSCTVKLKLSNSENEIPVELQAVIKKHVTTVFDNLDEENIQILVTEI